jgi:hypothetical protein
VLRNSDRDGPWMEYDGRRWKTESMTPLDVVLADIATLEGAREALPSHSHIAPLIELTLHRLREEADAMHRVELKTAA